MPSTIRSVSLSDSHLHIRVQEAIAQVAAELNPDGSAQQQSKAIQKVKKKARKILQEMVATVSPGMIRYLGDGGLRPKPASFDHYYLSITIGSSFPSSRKTCEQRC